MKRSLFHIFSIIIYLSYLIGCTSNSCSKASNNYASLVAVVLDDSASIGSRQQAIDELQELHAWDHLVLALPPQGKYDSTTINVIKAIVKIGNPLAIPYLEGVRNTKNRVSGRFWVTLNNAIQSLENKKSVQIPSRP